jgi:RNA polymerase primary sigma factor
MELARVLELLDNIDEREASILRMRYGLETGRSMTLKAIGEELGMTRERVRQMEQEGLRKLNSTMSREFGEENEEFVLATRKKRRS